jgi:HAD superfamily hydrolase (TIGR01509 family)
LAADTIKGMFFDLDGTLCSTDEANYAAYAKALAEVGYTFRREDFPRTRGLNSKDFLPLIAPGIQVDDIRKVVAKKAEYYPEFMYTVKPNHELINFLSTMRGRHVTVLVTTAKRINAPHVLRVANLVDSFDHMVFGDDIEYLKPHPQAYLRALELTGLQPAEVIAFEDSDVGAAAAAAAGIAVIRVRDNHAL